MSEYIYKVKCTSTYFNASNRETTTYAEEIVVSIPIRSLDEVEKSVIRLLGVEELGAIESVEYLGQVGHRKSQVLYRDNIRERGQNE